jgi:superoxide dismutase, Fe-Mn family
MAFTLPPLPYDRNALAPVISAETIDYHYGKHHQTYVTNLNNLTAGTPLEHQSLEQIVRTAEGGIFNNAAQVWNHTFYWNGLKPGGSAAPAAVADALVSAFGSFDAFKEQFSKAAVGHFGSGWAWLVVAGGKLAIESTANAGCPLRDGKTPLLTCDVWEHAYYIDYRNLRAKYVEAFWGLVNWDFVAANLAAAR